MQGLVRIAAVCAIFWAGCAMATSDRLWIVEVDADRDLLDSDTVHLYSDGWVCSGTVAEIRESGVECPTRAPARVTWRVDREQGETPTRVLGRGEGATVDGVGGIGGDGLWIVTVQ